MAKSIPPASTEDIFSCYLWKMPVTGHWLVGGLVSFDAYTNGYLLVGGQWAELRECRVSDSHLAVCSCYQPAVLHVAGLGGQLCPPCQLCPGCQPCLCSRAVDGWKHSSVLLLASWMACPWVLGWKLLLSIFFSSFSHFLVDSDSRNCYFQFFHLAFFSRHCLLLNTQRSLTTLLL